MSLLPSRERTVRAEHSAARYEVSCDHCSLDTYGGEEYLQIGREHVVEHPDHIVRVRATYHVTLSAGADAERHHDEFRARIDDARTALLGGENSAVAHMLGVDTVDRIADS